MPIRQSLHGITIATLTVGGIFVGVSGDAFAQQIADPIVTSNPVAGGATVLEAIFKKTPSEVWLSCLVFAFGALVILAYVFAVSKVEQRRPEDLSRALIVMAIITGSLLLITAGYSSQQVAPAFGLFGTIIGYMLGRMSGGQEERKNVSKSKDEQND